MEVLIGVQRCERELLDDAASFLKNEAAVRHKAVLEAIRIYLNIVNGW